MLDPQELTGHKEFPLPSLKDLVTAHPNAFYQSENTLNSSTPHLLLREKPSPDGTRMFGVGPDHNNPAPSVLPTLLITESQVIIVTSLEREGATQKHGLSQVERYDLAPVFEFAGRAEPLPTLEDVAAKKASYPKDMARIDEHNGWALVRVSQLANPQETQTVVATVCNRSDSDFEQFATDQISLSEAPSLLSQELLDLQRRYPNRFEEQLRTDEMGRLYLLTKPITHNSGVRYLFTPDKQCFRTVCQEDVTFDEIPVSEIMHQSRNIDPKMDNVAGIGINLSRGRLISAFLKKFDDPETRTKFEAEIS
jgi:hypothetical protein